MLIDVCSTGWEKNYRTWTYSPEINDNIQLFGESPTLNMKEMPENVGVFLPFGYVLGVAPLPVTVAYNEGLFLDPPEKSRVGELKSQSYKNINTFFQLKKTGKWFRF